MGLRPGPGALLETGAAPQPALVSRANGEGRGPRDRACTGLSLVGGDREDVWARLATVRTDSWITRRRGAHTMPEYGAPVEFAIAIGEE